MSNPDPDPLEGAEVVLSGDGPTGSIAVRYADGTVQITEVPHTGHWALVLEFVRLLPSVEVENGNVLGLPDALTLIAEIEANTNWNRRHVEQRLGLGRR